MNPAGDIRYATGGASARKFTQMSLRQGINHVAYHDATLSAALSHTFMEGMLGGRG